MPEPGDSEISEIQPTSTTEIGPVSEVKKNDWDTMVILQRHGEYDNNRPKNPANPTPAEQLILGRITEEGKKDAAAIADQRIESALTEDLKTAQNTFFLLINSPTYWLDNPTFGQRAK